MSRLELSHIAIIGQELAIVWSDGEETYLPLERLRKACPCAVCQGEPDVTGYVIRPKLSYTEKSFELSSWELSGGYAIQLAWADGHRTGLYSYDYLKSFAL